jgi:fumarate hydratase class II
MDATPLRASQELGGFARQMELGIARAEAAGAALAELALGGTAVGTGLNRPADFPRLAIAELSRATGLAFREAGDHFEAQASRDAAVEASGALRTIAVSLFKIASDVRLLASGPRCGLGELRLPALQPGSSIMPGKVNPVMPELLGLVAFRVMANDLAVTFAAKTGQLQLNAYEPLVGLAVLESQTLLENTLEAVRERCVEGIRVNEQVLARNLEETVGIVTALNPVIGYERASELASEAYASGKGILELIREKKVLSEAQIAELLDPVKLTGLDESRYPKTTKP